MSFWKKLFGGAAASGSATAAKSIDHAGFRIEAQPYREAGQFQVAGVISRTIDGVVKEHRFVRADRFGTLEEAADFALMKGRQIIDQQGDRLFGG
jgi:hypothetical protein